MMARAMREALVSVVIPAYNADRYVAHAVDSALRQTYPTKEIIVVNDGSTDDTCAVLEKYQTRIAVISQPNMGLSGARNTGIRHAHGEFVAFLDADDCWRPDKVRRQVDLLAAHPSVGFCSTHTLVENEHGERVGDWCCPEIRQSILHTIFICNAAVPGSGSGVLVRKHVLDIVGYFDESLSSLEDIDMWLRMAAVTDYRCIADPLTVIVKRGGSLSSNLDTMRQAALMVMKKHRGLLGPRSQGAFWRAAYAGVLADYAKWEYRAGRKVHAFAHLLEGLVRSPWGRGRMLIGLMAGMLRGRIG